MDRDELSNKSTEPMDLSYSPSSKFRVGAALLTKSGDVYLGANIENAAYGCCMCGERNAIYNAYKHGVTQDDIEALAIVADCPRPVSPCVQCRQVLSELFPKNKPIYLANLMGDIKETNIDELLPYGFEEEDMN